MNEPHSKRLAAVLFLVLGISATASILVSAATFLNEILPGDLPVNWVALVLMVIVTFLSLERIGPTGWVTTAMLVLELAVIIVFTIAAFCHTAPHHASLTHPVLHHGGVAQALGFSGLLAAVVPALFAFNGYDWPLYFAEEAKNCGRALPRAVLLAAGISIFFELAAVVAATMAIKDPVVMSSDDSPLTAISHDILGSTGTTILLVGVVIAMFDTGLAGNLGYARVFYAVARDDLWPGPLNAFFSRVSKRNQVPVNGVLVLFIGNAVLCMATGLQNLITFTGVVIVTIYLLIACSAIICRMRDKRLTRPFRMPVWPLAPVMGLLGCLAALSQQTTRDLTIAGVIVVLALGAYGGHTAGYLPVSPKILR